MKDFTQPKVVFDRVLLDTFLSMAVEEGLLKDESQKTDGYLLKYKNYVASPRLKEIVLEQVVLTPNILTTQYIPIDFLSGPIAEERSITHIEHPTDNLIKIGRFSKTIINEMLISRGHVIPENEFEERLIKTQEALAEEEAYTKRTGIEPPDMNKKKWLDIIGTTFEHEYSAQEYADAEKRQKAYADAKPLLDCMLDYLELATVASNEKTIMRIPTSRLSPILADNELLNFAKDEPKDIALIRVVAHEFGHWSYRKTLKESLELAKNPNMAALRKKLIEWKNLLPSGEIDKLESIRKEIREARLELAKLKSSKKIGKIITYLGIPITLLETFTYHIPILGATATVIGTALQGNIDAKEKKFEWVMFENQ